MRAYDPIIEVRNLTIGYNNTTVLNDLTFHVNKGEIFVLLGGSGCGKSTLLKHMIGLYKPWKGDVIIDGCNFTSADDNMRATIIAKFGVAYQRGALFGNMTLLENVRLPLEEFTDLPLSAMNRIASMKLRLVQLNGFEDYRPSEISGGMQKRAALARAIALDPMILFLDEPSAGLDPITSLGLDTLIQSLARDLNITIVVVSHELQSIFAIGEWVVFLDKETKQIIAEGAPNELRTSSTNDYVRTFLNRGRTNA